MFLKITSHSKVCIKIYFPLKLASLKYPQVFTEYDIKHFKPSYMYTCTGTWPDATDTELYVCMYDQGVITPWYDLGMSMLCMNESMMPNKNENKNNHHHHHHCHHHHHHHHHQSSSSSPSSSIHHNHNLYIMCLKVMIWHQIFFSATI